LNYNIVKLQTRQTTLTLPNLTQPQPPSVFSHFPFLTLWGMFSHIFPNQPPF